MLLRLFSVSAWRSGWALAFFVTTHLKNGMGRRELSVEMIASVYTNLG